jgi:hypothetical protein
VTSAALAASLIDTVLGLAIAPAGPESSNRISLEGLTLGSRDDGAREIGIRKLEAASLRVASGPLTLEIGHFALHELMAQVRIEGGRPRLSALEAASAEASALQVHGPLNLSPQPGGHASSWSLGPLAAADGTIRAEIVDAHLLFDADVTVPIRQGQVDFKDTTVEHVGPDSRMGVSRLGLYVDAPNGRSYLYQFPSAPMAGVEYERRGALLGPWVTDRGKLQLQAFAEGLLRQAREVHGMGVTGQARLLFDRTAVSGDVQLGDGRFAAPGVQADLVGRADGRNVVRLHSEAVGRGLSLEMASLAVRDAVLHSGDMQMSCGDVGATLTLRLSVEDTRLRFAFDLTNMKLSGLRLATAPQAPRAA